MFQGGDLESGVTTMNSGQGIHHNTGFSLMKVGKSLVIAVESLLWLIWLKANSNFKVEFLFYFI